MPLQHCISYATAGNLAGVPSQPVLKRDGTAVFLVTGTGGPGSEAAGRLLARALSDSGLAAHEPQEIDSRAGLPRTNRQCPTALPRLVIAFGAEAAARFLNRPVSLNLERGRLRPLPEGGRLLLTEHPNAILRLADPVARGREYRRLVNDLLIAVPHRRLAA